MRTRVKVNDEKMNRLIAMLQQYHSADNKMAYLKDELRRYKEQEADFAPKIPTSMFDGTPRAKGSIADPTANAAIALDALAEHCRARVRDVLGEIKALQADRDEVDRLVALLDGDGQMVIRMRWLQKKSWISISIAMERCERQCQRIQRAALEKMAGAMRDGTSLANKEAEAAL